MLTMTINTDDVDVAKQIIEFVNSLKTERVFVETASTSFKPAYVPTSPPSEKPTTDWRDLIGLWEDYDIDGSELRKSAWKRDLSW